MSIGATLRSEISLRKADPTKEPEILEWLNGFDRRSLGYPLSEAVAAHVNGTTHAVIPVQQVALIEAVATNPASTKTEKQSR